MARVKLRIRGMTCEHCARTVERALESVPGVRACVSYADAIAEVEVPAGVGTARLVAAAAEKGYEARPAPSRSRTKPKGTGAPHVAILGAGSAAFAAAIRATRDGARVTMIESGTLGGTCVNTGCVPSKILIRAAHVNRLLHAHPFEGVARRRAPVDRVRLAAQQQARVDALRREKYEAVLKGNPNMRLVRGRARFEDAYTLIVERVDGRREIVRADRILIATGARPAVPEIPGLKAVPFWTSAEALAAQRIPSRLVVIGGSVVAVELAQAFARLGAQVTMLARSTLLSREDPAIGEGLKRAFEAEGIRVLLHTTPEAVSHERGAFTVKLAQAELECDALLVAVGRRPNTNALSLERAGVDVDASGAVIVDDRLRTSTAHIYAAGDCARLPQFVYVAAASGTHAAINMTGGDARFDLSVVPSVVFTDPQAAAVGLTEAQAKARGLAVETRTLALEHVPRALVDFDTRGFIKLVAERGSGRLLGAQVLAAAGGEVIQAAALALGAGLSVHDLAGRLFPYLTMVEGLKLCAQTFTRDIHRLSCCAG